MFINRLWISLRYYSSFTWILISLSDMMILQKKNNEKNSLLLRKEILDDMMIRIAISKNRCTLLCSQFFAFCKNWEILKSKIRTRLIIFNCSTNTSLRDLRISFQNICKNVFYLCQNISLIFEYFCIFQDKEKSYVRVFQIIYSIIWSICMWVKFVMFCIFFITNIIIWWWWSFLCKNVFLILIKIMNTFWSTVFCHFEI